MHCPIVMPPHFDTFAVGVSHFGETGQSARKIAPILVASMAAAEIALATRITPEGGDWRFDSLFGRLQPAILGPASLPQEIDEQDHHRFRKALAAWTRP